MSTKNTVHKKYAETVNIVSSLHLTRIFVYCSQLNLKVTVALYTAQSTHTQSSFIFGRDITNIVARKWQKKKKQQWHKTMTLILNEMSLCLSHHKLFQEITSVLSCKLFLSSWSISIRQKGNRGNPTHSYTFFVHFTRTNCTP